MANKFDVCVKELKKVDDIPGTWDDKDYHSLMSMSEVDGKELLEMTIMVLQDSNLKRLLTLCWSIS
jgi:hypothetical protein